MRIKETVSSFDQGITFDSDPLKGVEHTGVVEDEDDRLQREYRRQIWSAQGPVKHKNDPSSPKTQPAISFVRINEHRPLTQHQGPLRLRMFRSLK